MADAEILTHAYLDAHPADAARVLEQLSAGEAAALLEQVPARLGAPVLAAMLPSTAGQCLREAEPARAAMLLAATNVPAAASILRYVPERQRMAFLEMLPTAHALACRALLGFPEDAVGACVNPQIVALAPDVRARDALETIRARKGAAAGPVYVVDAQRRPVGQVEVATLLRAGEHERLDQLTFPVTPPLAALMSIAGALRDPVWQDADVVPVTDRGDGLVGVVQRRDLLRAAQARRTPNEPAEQTLTGLLAAGYWQTVSGLLEVIVAALIAAPRRRP